MWPSTVVALLCNTIKNQPGFFLGTRYGTRTLLPPISPREAEITSMLLAFALPLAASWAHVVSPIVAGPRTHAPHMTLFDFFGGGGEPEQVSLQKGFAAVSHILLCGAEADEQATSLKERIDGGELSFEDAAVQFSQCRSKGKLGNLGAFRGPTAALPLGLGRVWNLPYEGKEVPEFDKLVFDEGTALDVVHIVSTDFGTHLVKVTDRGPTE